MPSQFRAFGWLAGAAVALALPLGAAASAASAPDAAPAGAASAAAASADPHAMHHHLLQDPPTVARSLAHYVVPDVALVRSDGARVRLAQELADGRPVLLNFIYTTCTTICPVMSQAFAEVQTRLGPDAAKVRMISVSIDPEEDTPAHLAQYAQRFRAGPQWSFYTGTVEASLAVQRAFNVYRGDKMNHAPVTFYRAAPDQPWVRLDGFATPDAVLREVATRIARQ